MSPSNVKSKLVGDTVIEVATGVGGVGGAVGELPLSPHAVSSTSAANVRSLYLRVFFRIRQFMAQKDSKH